MGLNSLFNAGKRLIENIGSEKVQEALNEGFIVKTDSGDYFIGNINGNLEYH